MGILDKIFNRNNTYYTNREGTQIPARINVKYRRNYLGFNLPTKNPALATDTIVTLSPSVRGATTQRITLSGPDSHTEHLDNVGEWIPSDYNDYWEPRGREAISNLNKKPTQQVGIKQQGGTMNAEQQELQYALIGYVVATKKQPKDENEINQLAQALVQLKQQDPEKFNQLVQLGQQAQQQQQATRAERGAKLNYIKSLKGHCPDGEELVYFKKGGMIECGCKKKEKGGEVEQPKKKSNAVDEFKKARKGCKVKK